VKRVADQTQTDKALMETTAKNFETVNGELQGSLTTLQGKVTALQSGWVGQGGTSFQNTMTSWSTAQKQINQLLQETAGLIRTAGQSYTTADDDAGRSFNSTGTTDLKLS
jgi:WXG100 family type VII secretion target